MTKTFATTQHTPGKHAQRMVQQLRQAGIGDEKVLQVMGHLPREQFVARGFAAEAYENAALPIGENQTISQPLVVAAMTEALSIHPQHKVLEIGTGSGYQLAVLCKLVRRVFTVERFLSLSVEAESRLHSMGINNFARKVGDGSLGWPEQAPFDRIIVTAAAPFPPATLLAQLKPGGVMVVPVGTNGAGQNQNLCRYLKHDDGTIHEEVLGQVRFVPLVGAEGVRER